MPITLSCSVRIAPHNPVFGFVLEILFVRYRHFFELFQKKKFSRFFIEFIKTKKLTLKNAKKIEKFEINGKKIIYEKYVQNIKR